MILFPGGHPLAVRCRQALAAGAEAGELHGDLLVARLPASRPVFRFAFPDTAPALVGKFFFGYPPASAQDRSLLLEFRQYQEALDWDAGAAGGVLPRCLGQAPELKLGLLLEAVDGPDLDYYLARAQEAKGLEALQERLERLARLLARFHARPVSPAPVSGEPALLYLGKLAGQLAECGLLCRWNLGRLAAEAEAWEPLLKRFPDRQVLLHGDATPTNFLFPDGKVVALDLERLRPGDRLFDLSWVAGELKHAYGWRFGDFSGAEAAIAVFFAAYHQAAVGEGVHGERLFRLNPLYMALAELRIARNAYLPWDYRRRLVEEALNCLSWGRRTP